MHVVHGLTLMYGYMNGKPIYVMGPLLRYVNITLCTNSGVLACAVNMRALSLSHYRAPIPWSNGLIQATPCASTLAWKVHLFLCSESIFCGNIFHMKSITAKAWTNSSISTQLKQLRSTELFALNRLDSVGSAHSVDAGTGRRGSL